jgi:5-methylcytosine-specific restriction endonuclease McrA
MYCAESEWYTLQVAKPCKCGGESKRYADGKCIPCAQARQAKHRATRLPSIARLGLKPCVNCGSENRYVSGDCKDCAHRNKVALYWSNPEKYRLETKVWRSANPERCYRNRAAWAREHPDKQRASTAKCVAANIEGYRARYVAASHRRRAIERGAQGSYTLVEWAAKKNRFGKCCIDCGMKEGSIFPATAAPKYASKPMKLTVGHAIPLILRGSNFIGNLIPQCGPCNNRQGAWRIHPSVKMASLFDAVGAQAV